MAARRNWRKRWFLGEMTPMRTIVIALLLVPLLGFAGASEHAPKGTFADTFLILPEEVRDAAKAGRRVIVFFEQEGCPACLRMARTTFVDGAVTQRLRRQFVLIAVDLNGARETVWLDGVARPEKALARQLGVNATPTVLILDEQGRIAQQFVGYRDPKSFAAMLDAAASK
ncbi:MAG: thioredoxin family protein [Betaproteobacteria bacterium]|nr:MAG: thioredoxin family protein [Betaproteobacteria bacterium]